MIAWAQSSFVVNDIKIEGLQHISPATVESYLPIKRGQVLEPAKTGAIVRALYQTGFFDRISLVREGHILIIHVIERPTIGQLKISGNSVIPTDKLTGVMRSLDISEGRVYNEAMLTKIKQSLLNQYYQLGRYNARVDMNVTPMSRNRVLVKINISEGVVAKIKRISIIGAHAFSEKTLLKQLDMTTTGLLTIITQSDRYSEEKLDINLEKLRNYYLDRGYIQFAVKSAQAEITPDRKSVFVIIVIEEGPIYTVKDYFLEGRLILPKEVLLKQIDLERGEPFSRQKVLDSEKKITKLLGDQGYLFSTVNLRPQINEKTHELILVFNVEPGKRIYVRQITFSDNQRTNDEVLRRELEQWEASKASATKLEESKHRISLLPYVREVDMSIKPVPDVDDKVDVNYKIKEDSAAQASFKVGYSQLYHLVLAAGLNQKNFLGTGNTLGINLSRSNFEQFYGIEYTDPYYTADGISRSFNFSISRTDPGVAANVNGGYTINEYNLGVLYGIPIGQEVGVLNRVMLGASYQDTLVNLSRRSGTVSNQVNSFVNNHGRHYQEIDLRAGYSRDSRDKAIFPTKGGIQTLFLDTYVGTLGYYALNYHGKWYYPLNDQFILTNRANLGYANGFGGIGDFPFFRNYYSGGIGSIRGYEDYTLGPRDSNGKALGGNMLVDASVGIIFPNYMSDNLRTSLFVDAGNVYSSMNNRNFGGQSSESGPIRFSTGIEMDILTPFGAIELSLAKAFRQPHDRGQPIAYALGANF